MPEAGGVAVSDWTLEGTLLVEPRLSAAGLRHGMTTLGVDTSSFSSVLAPKQEHGVAIHEARPGMPRLVGDGLVSRTPGLAIGVFTADCVPLLLWSDDGRTVGAFHAGWRGLAAGMARAAVAAMGGPARLSAAVGPHIGPCCYTVGEDLLPKFDTARFRRDGGRLVLDLGAEARAQLSDAGIPSVRTTVSSLCTSCRPELASWRRDRVKRNMLTFVTPA